ncbi:YugN family protein [Paenibacillus tarimensis]|uniref:YugN family protein n=1 Tax=Paenibacillus tarimensis TaxID=416012 RepID=UPI001F290C00|nr:YugN family protein [Paenibacillus tarimensis]MCF2943818.1 YugN-like family protein [Paenibacillus tarimensis]
MIPISSSLENSSHEFTEVRNLLKDYKFSLGGNWDYKSGFFDRFLDEEAHKVWLRLPFEVTSGNIDEDREELDAKIRFGQPFVLKHLYNEGIEHDATPRVFGALFDQFQHPLDPDAPVEDKWLQKGEEVLRQIERIMPG